MGILTELVEEKVEIKIFTKFLYIAEKDGRFDLRSRWFISGD